MTTDDANTALAERTTELAAQIAAGTAPAGRLLGLPELPDDGVWVDIAGAAVVAGVQPKTITGWLSRCLPASSPFPLPTKFLYRLYWPLAEIEAWKATRPTR